MVNEEKKAGDIKANEIIRKDAEAKQSEKGTYLVAMEIKATYTQLITSETRRNAEEAADVACQKGDFKKGLLDVTKIETGTVQKGIMKKIGAQIVFFPSGGEKQHEP